MKYMKKIIISLICTGLLFSLLHFYSYAENKVQTTTNAQTNQTSKATSTQSTAKTSNANLKNLGIKPNDFKGFKSSITSYKVNVPEKVNSIEIYATAENSKAKVEGTGKKNLETGENYFDINVTAEDGTKKTYNLEISRGEANTNSANQSEAEPKIVNGLSDLKVNGLQLSPEFKTDIFEYSVKYIGEDTSLNIQATPTMANYEVEIVGNKELKEGENNITILVTDSNEKNIATYQIMVNKSLVDEEAIAKEEIQKNKQKQKIIIISGMAFGALIIIIIIVIIVRHKRNNDFEEYFTEGEDDIDKENEDEEEVEENKKDEEDFDEEDEDEEDEIPKALRKKKEIIESNESEEKRRKRSKGGKRYK